jgi:hypothetical protein
MKYTTDGKCSVYAGKIEVARSYVGYDGYEVRVLQGMPRTETIAKIFEDCPEFAKNNNIDKNYYPKLFSESKKK